MLNQYQGEEKRKSSVKQNPDGSRRDIGAYGGPYALTPMPVIPTWPPPFTATPTPVQSNTPIPTHTPTSPPTTTPSPPTYTPTSIPSGSATPTPTDPGQTPTDLPTGTPTSTPTPVDQTATPTPTPAPSTTPTPTPLVTGVTITMPAHQYRPGDPCYCTVTVTNGDPEPLIDHPLFLILDVYGEYFFAPSFTADFDSYPGPWPPGITPVEALPEFTWPDTGTTASGIIWYAAITDPAVTRIVGEWDHFEFSWE